MRFIDSDADIRLQAQRLSAGFAHGRSRRVHLRLVVDANGFVAEELDAPLGQPALAKRGDHECAGTEARGLDRELIQRSAAKHDSRGEHFIGEAQAHL